MSVSVQCPNPACATTSQVPDHFRGHSVRCRVCRHKFKVPTGPAAATALPPPLPSAVATDDAFGTAGGRPLAAGPLSSPPTRIGRFELRGRLGAGAFGAVYRAFDSQLQREVALKVPHPGTLDNPKALERFLREARASARLRHPHIVPVFDAGRDGAHDYLASAFVDGRTLADAIDEQPPDFEASARIVRGLAVLAYAHKLGIVHRDVKPANVMLDAAVVPHLMDFGLAHKQDEADKLTQDGALLGTPAYMAPEQAKGQEGEPLPASDQYSLGVVLYELLTGRTPFSGPPQIVLFNVLNQEPPPPRSINAKVPRDLETICLKAMAKEPGRRYADCQELADDLRRWQEGEPIRGRRLGVAERVVRWVRREPWLAALGAVTVVCLLAVGAVGTISALKVRASQQAREEDIERARQSAAQAAAQARISQEKAVEAETQIARAKDIRAQAEATKKEADGERERTNKAARAANATLTQAERREREGRQALYQTHLKLAQAALKKGDRDRVRAWIERYRDSDLRTEEYRDLAIAFIPARSVRRDHAAPVNAVAFSPDGKSLVAVGDGHDLTLWDVATGKRRVILRGHSHALWSVSFSPDGKTLATGGNGAAVQLWDVATGKERIVLRGHADWVRCVAFSPDGKTLASVGGDKTLRLWDVATGAERGAYHSEGRRLMAVAFSPDGRTLAFGGDDSLTLWDVATGKVKAPLRGDTRWICSLAFSPDGKTLASGGDGAVRLWDVVAGKERATLDALGGQVWSVMFSPDGATLASAGDGKIVRLWASATGKKLAALKGHAGSVYAVAFSPDGKALASAGDDKTVRLWDVSLARAIPHPKPAAAPAP